MKRYPIIESLFYSYEESLTGDSEEIKKQFGELDEALRELSVKKSNDITSVVCHLCTEHERRAYISGVYDAVHQGYELNEIATSLRSSQ